MGSSTTTESVDAADRDSEGVAEIFDERDAAVAEYLRQLIARAAERRLLLEAARRGPRTPVA